MLFAAQLMRAVGTELSVFFLPLFFFQAGQKMQIFAGSPFQNGVIFVALYYLIERLGVFSTSIPVGKFIAKFGLKNTMVFSQILYVITCVLYVVAEKNPIYFLPILLIEAFRIPLFWCSYYTLFSMNAIYRHMGESVGTSEFFTRLLQAAIPALSGLMIVEFGFSAVFFTSIFFQGISTLLFLFVQEKQPAVPPSVKELRVWLKEPEFRMLSFSLVGKYALDTLHFLWPLFVVLLIGSADKVGYLYFVVLFVSLLLTYFAGWYVDHSKGRKPFAISGSILGGLWVVRAFVHGIWPIMAVDIFDRLARSVFNPFYDSMLLRRGKGDKTLSYFVYREMIISFAGIIFWGGMIIYFLFFDNWRQFILIGFVAVLMSMQLKDTKASVELKEDRP